MLLDSERVLRSMRPSKPALPEEGNEPHLVLLEPPRRVTLQDVARAAGVNITTASDALKGTGRVSASTREKVRKIAAEWNYVPNSAARALVTGRTGTVAVMTGAVNEHYYANAIHYLEKQMAACNYKMLLLRTRREVQDVVASTDAASVDGVVAIDNYHLVDDFIPAAKKPVRPAVFLGTYDPQGVDYVRIDLTRAVEAALQTMVDAGRRRIAYLVTSEAMARPQEARTHAYLNFMERIGRTPEVININANVFSARDLFREHIQAHGCPDGLLCQNDDTAISAYRGILDTGRRVPDDILLVGCDGLRHMALFEVPLSTIEQPLEECCVLAWQFLQARMAEPDRPMQHATREGFLIRRESLG